MSMPYAWMNFFQIKFCTDEIKPLPKPMETYCQLDLQNEF